MSFLQLRPTCRERSFAFSCFRLLSLTLAGMLAWAPTLCSAGSFTSSVGIADDAIENLKLAANWMERAWFQSDDSTDIPVPPNWVVNSPEKVTVMEKLSSGRWKEVHKGKIEGVNERVVIKMVGHKHDEEEGFENVRLEILTFQYLYGLPGIPRLYGAWIDDDALYYAMTYAGHALGAGPTFKGLPLSTRLREPFYEEATQAPIKYTINLLKCFWSFSEIGGFLMEDMHPGQFALDDTGELFIVDGPEPLMVPEEVRELLDWEEKYEVTECTKDDDCEHSRAVHCCCHFEHKDKHNPCEEGYAGGAPESQGICVYDPSSRSKSGHYCKRMTSKTHSYDLAAKLWLLPSVVESSKQRNPFFAQQLAELMQEMRHPIMELRPSLAEAIERVENFNLPKRVWLKQMVHKN